MGNETLLYESGTTITGQRKLFLGTLIVDLSIRACNDAKGNEEFHERLTNLTRLVEYSPDHSLILQDGIHRLTKMAGTTLLHSKGPEDWVRKAWIELMHPEQCEVMAVNSWQALKGTETLVRADRICAKWYDQAFYAEVPFFALRMADVNATRVLARDASDRKRHQAAIAELSQHALDETNIELVFDMAVHMLASTLSIEYAQVLEYKPEQHSFLLKAGVGWRKGWIGSTMIDIGMYSQASYTLFSKDPVIVENLRTETRFTASQLLLDHQVISGMSVIIQGSHHPYGVLSVHTKSYQCFTQDEIHFLEGTAEILASAIRRKKSDLALQRDTERLQALHEIDRAILSGQSIHQIAGLVVTHMRRHFPCERASVVTLNFPNHAFSVIASESNLDKQSRIRNGPIEHFPGDIDVLSKGEICLDEDISKMLGQNPTIRDLYAEGVRAFACVPVFSLGKLVGSLKNVGFGKPGKIQPDQLKVAIEVANTLTIAFEHANRIEIERRRLMNLKALHTIDLSIINRDDFRTSLQVVVEKVISCLQVDAAAILLYDATRGILNYGAGSGFRTDGIRNSQLRLGEGIAGQAALHKMIMMARNLNEVGEVFVRHPLLVGEDIVAYFAVPLIVKDQLKGVLDIFHRSPLDPDKEWLDFLQSLAAQAAIAIDNAQLFLGMQKANRDLAEAYDATIEGWSRALDLRDKETEGHTLRVTQMTVRFAKEVGLSEEEMVHIRRGSLLHDMGKLGVPDAVLIKPEELSKAEWELMRKHPSHAFDLLAPIEYLQPALAIPYCHHEKWDGSGYPRGLKGEEIPFAARIFAVIDVWDALRSDRPYRKAWSKEDTLAYIAKGSGSHFDPQIVTAFIHFIESEGATKD